MNLITVEFWIVFNIVIITMLVLDLKVVHRKAHAVSVKEALGWSIFWIVLSLLFNVAIYFWMGQQKAVEFFTGYVIEKSLSVDNLFVFVLIFKYFNVPDKFQPRILHWGILGALVMRFLLIFGGSALLNRFHWIFYVFGVVIIITAIRMLTDGEKKLEPEKNPVIKLFRKLMPVSTGKHVDDHFFVHEHGRWAATPLFIALLVVESSDLIFAVDSIPAIFAITRDTFIVYTSNVFAILGLRALYFLLNSIIPLFVYLKYGISIVLMYVGVKMLIMEYYKIPTLFSLCVVVGILGVSIAASLIFGRSKLAGEPGEKT
ncbi:MAG: tellurium resistance protein TerC [Elusimicrobia bacterium RIFCSPLOWO2_01_FULL_54_10]|nr:MAG: tellurium resistance protein TerC [Elusimicrobia bacterium RIFCSPLOWO2_01_FULL_54_10]